VLRYERWDVISALGLAGLVNLAILPVAAKVFTSARSPARPSWKAPWGAAVTCYPPRHHRGSRPGGTGPLITATITGLNVVLPWQFTV
jgi:hypothetical protein